MRKLKRITAPNWWPIERKVDKYIITPRGAHRRENSLPLTVLIRDGFKLVESAKEAKRVIKDGQILVDGKKRKDPNYGVGLFDVVEIPRMKKAWRAVPKNGLTFIEIPKEESNIKICKIVGKKTLRGNKIQLNLHDGKNIISEEKYSTNDSVLLEFPELKIVDYYKLDTGSTGIVIGGKNAGIVTKVGKIEGDRIWMGMEKMFEVPRDLVMIVGKQKPAIKLE